MGIQEFDWFMAQVYQKLGVDLTKYKRPQMERRITALRDKCGYADFQTYFQAMSVSSAMQDEFLDRMTINVSEFFRNPGRFQVVEDRVLPECLQHRKKLRVWSAACSTGEEPYSLAMLMQKKMPYSDIQILATDIDKSALDRAQTGIFSARSVQNIPQDLLQKFFRQLEDGRYEITSDLRNRVKFEYLNLLEDSFQKDFDLIVCRNVIIYFEEAAKDLIFRKFSASLRTGGILFVGSTEQIFSPAAYQFRPYDTFFYQKM